MATACVDIVCTDACSDNLPAVEFSICAPEINQGEIDAIFVTNVGNPLTDETDAAEWATRMAAIGATKIIELHVIGDKPAPEENNIMISRNIEVPGNKGHVINVEIQQTNQVNYDFLRAMECGKQVLVWYRTSGGLLYGGAAGIPGSLKLNEIITKSRKEIITFQGTFKWSAKHHPCRTLSPI